MKKFLLIVLAVVVLAAGGGAVWWKFIRKTDSLAAAKHFLEVGDIRSAAIELRNAVRNNPANPEAHLRLGILQLQTGDAVAAEKELRAARDAGSRTPEITMLLAQSYLMQGKNKELLAEFQPPAATPEMTAQLLITRSTAQVMTNDAAAAMISLAAAERLAPNSPNPPLAAARLAVSQNNLLLADEKITRALQLDPKRADALLLKAQILNIKSNRAAALETLDTALTIAPRFVAARLERANILLTMNEDSKAAADVDAVLAAQPNAAAAVYLHAVLLARAKDDAGADMVFQKLSGVMDRFPRAFFFQAIVKYDLGQMEQAIDAAQRYVNRNPNDPDGIKLLARILLATGRGDRAAAAMAGAIKAGTADAEMLDLMGRAYAATGKSAEAVQTFDKAVSMAPKNAEILTHLASAKLGIGDAKGAGDDLRRSLQLAPGRTNAAEALVVAALAAGDVEQASNALDDLRAQGGAPETVGMLNGALLVMKQDFAGARAQFEQIIATNPAQTQAKMALVQVLQLVGQKAEAEKTLTDILSQDPGNEVALAALLQSLLNDGRVPRAIAVVETAYTATPSNTALLLTLSDLYVRAGTPEKSIPLLDKAEKSNPPTAQTLAARARAQVALHQSQAARETYKRVLVQAPGDLPILRMLVGLESEAKDWDAARATLKDALKIHPDDPEMLRLLVGIDLAASGEPAAFATIARLQADPVTREAARTLVADLNVYTKHYLQAAEAYLAMAKATPSTALVMSAANAYMAGNQPALARGVLNDWLAAHPNDIDTLRALATLEIGSRHLEAAVPLLEKALGQLPSDPVALNNLAWAYQELGDKRALAMGRRAFLLQPSPQSADTLGWILLKQGDARDAMPLLVQAANSLKADPSVQFHLAAALKETGKRDEAIASLAKLVDLTPAFDEQPDARRMLQELQAAQ